MTLEKNRYFLPESPLFLEEEKEGHSACYSKHLSLGVQLARVPEATIHSFTTYLFLCKIYSLPYCSVLSELSVST